MPVCLEALMFLCSFVLMFAALAAAKERNGVSPYVLEVTRTAVRGLQPRSGLMSLCPYVLLFSALAAAKARYGVSPYVS